MPVPVPAVNDIVVYNPDGSASHRMTVGKEYAVTEYDPNDTGWPGGCCGTPFITVIADDGKPFSGFAYRFQSQHVKENENA